MAQIAQTPSRDHLNRQNRQNRSDKRHRLGRRIWANRSTYLLLALPFAATAVFRYWPIYGVLLAFKNFKARQGIWGSAWTDHHGFGHFRRLFTDPQFMNALGNTLIISLTRIVIMLVAVVGIALLINELRSRRFRNGIQTVLYLPHFLSWVIIGSLVYTLISINDSPYAKLMTGFFHTAPIPILTNPRAFRPMVYITSIWKEAGFGTIIYLAAIAAINPEIYESAAMDGANRLQRALHITLPGIRSTIFLLTLLGLGGVLSAGFDQIQNLIMPQTYSQGEIIDTLIYRMAFQGLGQFSYTAAMDLFKQGVGLLLILIINYFSTKYGEESIL
ncbi:putative multiple-sugar transport system permease YteP [Clostridia bacterium]|nr:putative multiple-sugar transport system permease YteP [Clostridia bacterium]